MKKTMKTLLALMAGVMTFSACSNENVLSDENPTNTPGGKGIRSFTAYTESDAATRATIDGFDVKWEEGDAITVFGNTSGKYTLTEGAGYTSGKFEVQEGDGVEGTDFYAICPSPSSKDESELEAEARSIAKEYGVTDELFDKVMRLGGIDELGNLELEEWHKMQDSDCAWISEMLKQNPITECKMVDGRIDNGYLPIVQTVDVEKGQVVDPKAVLMVAQADGKNNLPFRNVCAYIKVTTTKPCKKIVVRAHNSTEYFAGSFDVKVSDDPKIPFSKGSTVVTLQAKNGDLAAKTTYYIAVLPLGLSSGLSVKFYTTDKYYTESTTNEGFTLLRNHVYDGGEQPDDSELGTTGQAAISGSAFPMEWVQLWAGGPRFAKLNVKLDGSGLGYYDGSEMSFSDATKVGSEYIWGPDWYTPSMEEMEELMKAAQGNSEKVKCEYGPNPDYGGNFGFTFTGKEEGYSENSIFFLAWRGGDENRAEALYATASVNKWGWVQMRLQYDYGEYHCDWWEDSTPCYIRPVLKR